VRCFRSKEKRGKCDCSRELAAIESNAELNVESNAESKVKKLVRTGCSRTSS
jgi:hypothetical protein